MDTSHIRNNEPFSEVQIIAFIKEEVFQQRKVTDNKNDTQAKTACRWPECWELAQMTEVLHDYFIQLFKMRTPILVSSHLTLRYPFCRRLSSKSLPAPPGGTPTL